MEDGVRCGNGVLIRAESGEPLLQEIIEPPQRVRTRHRPAERADVAGIVGKTPQNISDRLFHKRIASCTRLGRRLPAFRQTRAVLVIERPPAAGGRAVVFEQNVHAPALRLIESGHERFLFSADLPMQEIPRTEEAGRVMDDKLHSASFGEAPHAAHQHVVHRVREVDAPRLFRDRRFQDVLMAGSFNKTHAMPLPAQLLRKSPHRRPVQHQPLPVHRQRPLRVVAEIQRMLDQHDRTTFRQRGMTREQLVRKYPCDIHDFRTSAPRTSRRPGGASGLLEMPRHPRAARPRVSPFVRDHRPAGAGGVWRRPRVSHRY